MSTITSITTPSKSGRATRTGRATITGSGGVSRRTPRPGPIPVMTVAGGGFCSTRTSGWARTFTTCPVTTPMWRPWRSSTRWPMPPRSTADCSATKKSARASCARRWKTPRSAPNSSTVSPTCSTPRCPSRTPRPSSTISSPFTNPRCPSTCSVGGSLTIGRTTWTASAPTCSNARPRCADTSRANSVCPERPI